MPAKGRGRGRTDGPPSPCPQTREFGRFPRGRSAFARGRPLPPHPFPFLLRTAPEPHIRNESVPESCFVSNPWGGAREGAEVGRNAAGRPGLETTFSLLVATPPTMRSHLNAARWNALPEHAGKRTLPSARKCAFSVSVDRFGEKRRAVLCLWSQNWSPGVGGWGGWSCFFLIPFSPLKGKKYPVLCRVGDQLERTQVLLDFYSLPCWLPTPTPRVLEFRLESIQSPVGAGCSRALGVYRCISAGTCDAKHTYSRAHLADAGQPGDRAVGARAGSRRPSSRPAASVCRHSGSRGWGEGRAFGLGHGAHHRPLPTPEA